MKDFEFELTDEQIESLDSVYDKADMAMSFMIVCQLYLPRLKGYEHLDKPLVVGKVLTGDNAIDAEDAIKTFLNKEG